MQFCDPSKTCVFRIHFQQYMFVCLFVYILCYTRSTSSSICLFVCLHSVLYRIHLQQYMFVCLFVYILYYAGSTSSSICLFVSLHSVLCRIHFQQYMFVCLFTSCIIQDPLPAVFLPPAGHRPASGPHHCWRQVRE